MYNICGADLIKKFVFYCLLFFSKHVWVVPLKDKKGTTITNGFQKILDKSRRKPNKIWIDKGTEFYNRSIKSHNDGKYVVAERFIRTLKTKICKYMTPISKNVYIVKLVDIVNKYNNTYHRTIKLKPSSVNDYTYIDFIKEINNKNPKFKVGDYVRMSKYKNIFAKRYTPNWSEEVFIIKES